MENKQTYEQKMRKMQFENDVKNVDIAKAIKKTPASVIYKRKHGVWSLKEMVEVKKLFEKRSGRKFKLDDIFLP